MARDPKRYIGDAVITIAYLGTNRQGRDEYCGTIRVPGAGPEYLWKFTGLYAAPAGFGPGVAYDSPQAIDKMATRAASFGAYYTAGNRPAEGGEDLDGYPPAAAADAIDAAITGAMDEEGKGRYLVRRSSTGPARLV